MNDENFFASPGYREEFEGLLYNLNDFRVRGEFDMLSKILASDVSVEYVGRRPEFAFAGIYQGRDEVLFHYKQLYAEVDFVESEIVDLLIEGPRAFYRRKLVVQHRGTGRRGPQEAWDTWLSADGKLKEGRVLVDIQAFRHMSRG